MTPSSTGSGIMAGRPPAVARPPFPRPAQAGDQVAEPLGAADPGRLHERRQAEQLPAAGQPRRAQPGGIQPGQPAPAAQRSGQRVRDVPAAGTGAAADQPVTRERRGGQQPALVAGKHRHRPCPRAPDLHEHAAGPAGHVGAARVPQVAADQPGTRPQADEPCRAHPPLRRGLGVGQREEPADLRGGVGHLGPPPRQRQVRRVKVRDNPAADEPQVRAQRLPRRTRQARRAAGEPLSRRRVQQHLRHRLQPQPKTVVRELAGRPQQVLRPLPPLRGRPRDHVPGERRRRRRHRRRPPPADITRSVTSGRTRSGSAHTVYIQ